MRAQQWSLGGTLFTIIAVVLTTVIVTYPLWDGGSRIDVRGRAGVELSHAVQVRAVLFEYAAEHDGAFPTKSSDIVWSKVSETARQFHDAKTAQPMGWLYYGGYHREDTPSTIILASPKMTQGSRRVVVYSDGSAQLLDEEKFVERISQQLNRR